MRTTLFALLFAFAADSLASQANIVHRRNTNWLYLQGSDPVTGYSYADWRINHPCHAPNTPGVPAGTRSYVWIPSVANHFAEPEVITGFIAPLGPSARTAKYPATIYYPETVVHKSRKVGERCEPDMTATPHFVLKETSLAFARHGFYEAAVSLSKPVTLPKDETDVVISLQWRGGDRRVTADTLSMWGDAFACRTRLPYFGWVEPGKPVAPQVLPDAALNLTYTRAKPSVNVQSDFGRQGQNRKDLVGYSISTYEAPLATKPAVFGWDVSTDVGRAAIALLNVGKVNKTPFNLLGEVFELNVADPAIGVLASAGYVLAVSRGLGKGPELSVPPLGGAAIGTHIGVEFVLTDQFGTKVLGTTQAAWVRVAN